MTVSDRRSFLTTAIATLGVAATAGHPDFLAARRKRRILPRSSASTHTIILRRRHGSRR